MNGGVGGLASYSAQSAAGSIESDSWGYEADHGIIGSMQFSFQYTEKIKEDEGAARKAERYSFEGDDDGNDDQKEDRTDDENVIVPMHVRQDDEGQQLFGNNKSRCLLKSLFSYSRLNNQINALIKIRC